jgi:hypothetical protein
MNHQEVREAPELCRCAKEDYSRAKEVCSRAKEVCSHAKDVVSVDMYLCNDAYIYIYIYMAAWR